MSHIDDRFNTNQVTIWSVGQRTPNGSPSYNLLGVFGATWKSGQGIKRDASGNEFVPKNEFYVDSNAQVNRGDIIAFGDVSGGQPSGDIVRVVDRYDNSFFGWSDTLVVMTE